MTKEEGRGRHSTCATLTMFIIAAAASCGPVAPSAATLTDTTAVLAPMTDTTQVEVSSAVLPPSASGACGNGNAGRVFLAYGNPGTTRLMTKTSLASPAARRGA